MSEATRQRILDAAESLFAERGFAATSLRTITTRADANLAAVNYHFGSKEELIRAVFVRRLESLNQERRQRLDQLREAGVVEVEAVLGAFIEPALRLSRDRAGGGERFARLLGRIYAEAQPPLREHIHGLYAETLEVFKEAFATALPHLPRVELYWRLHFLLGVLSYTLAGTDLMRLIADCRLQDPDDVDALLARLIPFLAAGLRAPLPEGHNR